MSKMGKMSGRNLHADTRTEASHKGDHTPARDVPAEDTFHFWNGDEYTGNFALYRDRQKIQRQGEGVYRTGDGDTYEGVWENDVLKENCKITFLDETVFTGGLQDMELEGLGKFEFRNDLQVETEFHENKIVGKILLKDSNNNLWKGTLEKDGNYVTFRPLHPFWQGLLNMTPAHRQMYYESGEENESVWDGLY